MFCVEGSLVVVLSDFPANLVCWRCLLISLWLLGDEESEEEEFGNVHIIELHKAEEPLGIHLTHFTGPDGM